METVNDLVRTAVERFDRHPALLIKPAFRTRTWRYRDLGEQVPRVARVLADLGLSPGDRVVLWAVNRPEWAVGFLAVAHAGLVGVPLDVRSTDEFASKVAAQTEPKLVLASRHTEEPARRLGLPVVLVETLPDLARGVAEPLPAAPVAPDDLLLVVFTSGTTGDPKGVMLTHRNVASNAGTLVDVFPFGPDERLLSVIPLSHMFGLTCDLLAPLAAGKTIVYPVSRQPAVLVRTFREFKVTMFLIVPQGLRLLSNAVERKVDAGGKRAQFERLHAIAERMPRVIRRLLFRPVLSQFGGRFRTFAVGASALEPELARRWGHMGIDCLQGYGATEMSPVISFTRPARNRIGSVGEPIPGVEVRIADDGEVLARGPNRFVGYWQNPEASAAAIDADGWYHTGDIGELDADGFLTLRGRKKDMIALPDGQKVYPDDVEAVLARDPRLRDASVVGLDGDGTGARVHAVLLLDDPAVAEAIVRDANAGLAGHQQIRGWTVWPDEDFPRTASLKVKKRLVLDRLAAGHGSPPPAAADGDGAGTAAARPQVATVASLTAQVAQVPFALVLPDARLEADLGLDSLGRVELLSVIEEELGAFIDDGQLDPDATVADLERLVDGARDGRPETGVFGWPLNPVVRAVGIGLQELLMVPFVGLFYRVRIRGEHNLKRLEGPVIFAPNHHLHSDNAIILTHLPLAWRWRLSVAAAADDIFGNPIRGLGAAVLGNAFPLAREGAIRRSLELLGARLDRDFSVLIFPEGELTVGGPMKPFKSGAGLIAVESAIPVVPMKVKIHRLSWIDQRGKGTSARGDVEVIFGEPMLFDAGTDAVAATARLEAAVAAL
ncbi:MAG TPA: AMP-binding protein [Candidatus Limnocylindria bacterium]